MRNVRKFYQHLYNRDWESAQKLIHEDFKWIGASVKEYDFNDFRRFTTRDVTAFPDASIDIKRIISQGDTVVVEYLMSGTHTGQLGDIRPTNKRVEVPYVEILDLEEGKIRLWKTYCNIDLIRNQLTG